MNDDLDACRVLRPRDQSEQGIYELDGTRRLTANSQGDVFKLSLWERDTNEPIGCIELPLCSLPRIWTWLASEIIRK